MIEKMPPPPCREDPDAWHDTRRGAHFERLRQQAQRVCETQCPVTTRLACLDAGTRPRVEPGIWGGLRENQRRDVRRVAFLRELLIASS